MRGTTAWILAMAYTKKHGGGGGGTNDYNSLNNRPKINGTTLSGDKSSEDLGVMDQGDELDNDQINDLISLLG